MSGHQVTCVIEDVIILEWEGIETWVYTFFLVFIVSKRSINFKEIRVGWLQNCHGSNETHKKYLSFLRFWNFLHISGCQKNFETNEFHFSGILRNTCGKMCWKIQNLYCHTTAAGDIKVIWAVYNSGGPIMIHSPYSWYSHLSYNHSITFIEKGYTLFIPTHFVLTIGTKRLP